ncbi:trichohyalin-like [Mercenaria mercenaria]|uniref:trichohyalin-like n=1 Tax=Mercenaria mercenaria TaxID=6596 RepID=UPI00234EDDE7|nr:trichohyalin-like [Mercenaria mercenaria]
MEFNGEPDYGERPEEHKLKEQIEQLQTQKIKVENEIKQNKLLKDKQRKEMERKRLEELKIKQEMERKKEERLRKLKAEKDRLAKELNQQENTLRSLKEETEYERKRKTERQSKDKTEIQEVLKEKDHWKGKLLKPTIPNLTEDTFDDWKIEVEVIMNSGLYEESMLRQAVRNSLCGQTRKILLTIPPSTTTKEIISKLENVYGNVRSGESVLAEFYMCRQGRDEGIAEWGIRLESIIQKAIVKGHIKESQKEEMLKTRFWRQLYSEEIKNATRMYFETAQTFEELRKKVRVEENEMKIARDEPMIDEKSYTIKEQAQTKEQRNVLEDLVDRMKHLETEISKAKITDNENRSRYRDYHRTDRGYNRKDDTYDRERRYYRRDRYDDRYNKEYARERRSDDTYYRDNRRRNNDRYNRGNGIDRRYGDRYSDYRERRRYSPRDRRNDRTDYLDQDNERRYYRDYRQTSEKENRDRRRLDNEREHKYYEDNRSPSHRDSGYRREPGEEGGYRYNREERRQTTNNEDKSNSNVNAERKDRDNREEKHRNYEKQDKKSSLNSRTSLSGSR